MTEIKAITFDFGNVVGFFDHRIASERLTRYSDLTLEEIHAALWGSRLDVDFEAGRLGIPEFVRRAREDCRLRCSDEEFIPAFCDIFRPNGDVCALVPRLKGRYRLLLGSNTSALHSQHFSQQFADTFRHFDALVFSHDVGARKPAATFFDRCRQLAGCAAEECLLIDDLPANVDGARACRWNGIVYTGFDALRRELAELGVAEGNERAE